MNQETAALIGLVQGGAHYTCTAPTGGAEDWDKYPNGLQKHRFVPLQGALIHVGREKQAAVMRFALLGAVHCNIGFLIRVENFLCDIIGIKVDQNAASLYLTRFFLA